MIQRLHANGMAYEVEGNVYFDSRAFAAQRGGIDRFLIAHKDTEAIDQGTFIRFLLLPR